MYALTLMFLMLVVATDVYSVDLSGLHGWSAVVVRLVAWFAATFLCYLAADNLATALDVLYGLKVK